jgi:iron complex outermembrane receptor protein
MCFISLAQGSTIKGIVTDTQSGDPLIGANIVLKGTRMGASTDLDGFFMISNIPEGDYNLEVSYVGYHDYRETISVGAFDIDLEISLQPTVYSGSEITVLADRAKPRETPVAYSNVEKKEIQSRLGSRDIPLVLNTTPSVYATYNGGGPGDARINIRGFDQRNIGVLINGIPINDMENGWVYWSNWDGLGDATNSLQVQRGMSAVNLATPSIGGILNIITDPTQQNAGLSFKQEFGNDGFLKSTFTAHSGLINGKYALSGNIVRKTGDGIVDKTWTDAWAYYLGASWIINANNRLEAYLMGAPQRHGQNRYKQNIAAYSHEFAKKLDDYDQRAITDKDSSYYIPQSESGLNYNQNWNTLNSSYDGDQFWNGSTHKRYNKDFLNESENYFHKPLANINWYTNLTEKLNIYTTVYYSGGKGGGTGMLDNDIYSYTDTAGVDQYTGAFIWDYASEPSRIADWDANIAMNIGDTDRKGNAKNPGESLAILRNSVNNQWTIGAVAKANYQFSEKFKGTFGVDWRKAEILHFREVRDLLGGKYFYDDANDLWTGTERQRKLGDKVDYDNTNTVNWFGFYGQGEAKLGNITGYGMVGYTTAKYTFVDHFVHDAVGDELKLVADNISGYQIKGGYSYQLTPEVDVFSNIGYVSKVPNFDEVISDVDGTLAEDPKNEKFTDIEGGVNYRTMSGRMNLRGNFYYTVWQNQTQTRLGQKADGSEILIYLSGMDSRHIGLELEGSYQPILYLRIDGAVSVGDWVYTDDVSGVYKDYDNPSSPDTTYNYYVKDLKAGDAPQTQFAIGGTVFPVRGLQAQLLFRYYAANYADWEPSSRTDASDRGQSWQAPSYGVLDFHATYDLPFNWKGVKLTLFAHVFNILDAEYIQDAVDNSEYNAWTNPDTGKRNSHQADAAEVYFGLRRTFNSGLMLSF